MTERIPLTRPKAAYGVTPEMEAYVAIFDEFKRLRDEGRPIYVEFTSGDRKGSIALFVPDSDRTDKYGSTWKAIDAIIRTKRGFYHRDPDQYEVDAHAFGTLRWTGRSNKVKAHLPFDSSLVYLRGYEGPTVWQKFDAKAAKEKLLEQPDQKDADGNVLAIGDRVIYANISYGSGTQIERGTVDRFEASVDSRRHEIFTIVRSDSGAESKISKSERLIMRMPT